jgi:hypothetical protein
MHAIEDMTVTVTEPGQSASTRPRLSRRWRLLLALAAVAVLTLVAVVVLLLRGGGGASPGEVLKTAHLAANAGRYSEANGYLSSSVVEAARSSGVDLQAVWDQATHNGQIQRLELLSSQVRGEGAIVQYQVVYRDGSSETNATRMVQERGRWKESFDLEAP